MFHDRKLVGQAAERFVEGLYLKSKFEILARNYRYGAFEVDLIAKRGIIVHFIEVKYRSTIDEANLALNQHQFLRIARAAEFFMRERSELMQIDAVLVDHKLQWERFANIMLA